MAVVKLNKKQHKVLTFPTVDYKMTATLAKALPKPVAPSLLFFYRLWWVKTCCTQGFQLYNAIISQI